MLIVYFTLLFTSLSL